MRELTTPETGYLAGMLLLSLVLPLRLSAYSARGAAIRKPCLRTVWMGQSLGALAALAVLASAFLAPYAAALGAMGCLCCALVLHRQLRHARPERGLRET